MKPARVVGRVMATRKDESLIGQRLLVLRLTDWNGCESSEEIVAVDAVGSGAGEFVFFVESRDASVALSSNPPVDAAIVGIIDGVALTEEPDGMDVYR